MTKKYQTWTALSIDKTTGQELSFLIFKEGNTIKMPADEARDVFPKAVERLERNVLMYMIYGGTK